MIVRILAASLAGAVVFFLLGWLLYGMALADFMKENTVQYPNLLIEPPNMIPLFLANFVWAFLLAFIFDYWANIRTFLTGAKGGAIVVFLIVLGVDLQFYAFMNLYKGFTPLIVDVITATVMGAIGGGVIGLVLGKLYKE